MRVLQLGPYPPPYGGVQSNLVAIHKWLRGKNIPCAVVNLTRHRQCSSSEVFYPKSALALAGLLWRQRHSIRHLHIGGELTLRLLGLACYCTLLPGKTVLSFHSGGYPSSPGGRSARPETLRGFVLRRLDRVIAINAEIAAVFEKFGVPRERIRLIPPHATGELSAEAGMPEELERFFELHAPTLITVGLLEPEYDLPLQIRTLGVIREYHAGAGLVIIGSGSLEEPLRRLIAEQPWAEHILLYGDLAHPHTLAAIARAAIMLRTTLYDGDAVSVREALHLGTPVIATDNGMRPQGVTLIPVSDAAKLARSVRAQLRAATPGEPQSQGSMENIEAVFQVYRELSSES